MRGADRHLTDEVILLILDGELDLKLARGARRHLASCEKCRSRMNEMVRVGEEFDRLREQEVLLSIEESRAMLKSRLNELVRAREENPGGNWLGRWANSRELAYISALLLLAIVGVAIGMRHRADAHRAALEAPEISAVALPEPSLTPGAVRSVTLADVCRVPEKRPGTVPVALQREVFKEYRLRNARLADYEVDFLITPELGGADDIRNLWPEPHYSVKWNSYVKDDLESYLRQRVCSGQIPLPTAQREIATDWISAYKKYFRTNVPLSEQDIRRRASLGAPTT